MAGEDFPVSGACVRLLAVGDLMLSDNRGTGAMIGKHGPCYPFAKIHTTLAAADLRFANLETPLSTRGLVSGKQNPHITFRANPTAIEGLRFSGFDVLSLANNHLNDYGEPALLDTLDLLKANGIHSVGAGRNEAEAYQAVIVERKGMRIGFLAYSAFANLDTCPASGRQSGIAWFDRHRAIRQIKSLRHEVDIVIVSLHWGMDFTDYPVPFQRKFARALVAAGAHLILGHHPHHLQGIERYRHGAICYSLGDFVFDQADRDTLLLAVELSKKGVDKVEVLPARINSTFQPERLYGQEAQKIIDRITLLSDAYQHLEETIERQMLNRYIRTNVDIFKKSKNGLALRNLLIWDVIARMMILFFLKVRNRLVPGSTSTHASPGGEKPAG